MANIASPTAAAAYGAMQKQVGAGIGEATKSSEAGGGFADALREVAENAIDNMRQAEKVSVEAAAGEADLLDVVSSVHDAEATLQTAVAIRDKVVQSYQEILRMPI